MTESIIHWLDGKSVFVTGATGFVGKMLVEKLLRCCPGLEKVYILVRSKTNADAQSRWEKTAQNPLFNTVRDQKPEVLSKVVVMNGDVSEIGLGLSEKDRRVLENNVSVIFHSAATVRFDQSLVDAVLLNTRGTLEVAKLAEGMKKLECLEHVSTTFCNCDLNLPFYEEIVYPGCQDWRTMIALAESDPLTLNTITEKVLCNHPNTYTFSKSLAEQIMNEYAAKLPVVIFRPSVVVGCYREPVPGWVDNFNGVLGVTVGVNKGILRVLKGNSKLSLDYVAVDYVVNGMILTAFHTHKTWAKEVQVYNCAYKDIISCTFDELTRMGIDEVQKRLPLDNNLWHPSLIIVQNQFLYSVLFFFLQILPGLVLDGILRLAGQKPMLMKLNLKIYISTTALSSFCAKNLEFDSKLFRQLWKEVPENEKRIIFLEPPSHSPLDFMCLYQAGTKVYLLNEKVSDERELVRLKKKYWRRYYLHNFAMNASLYVIVWLALSFLYRMSIRLGNYVSELM